jgi:gluconate 5-dehydrogenase
MPEQAKCEFGFVGQTVLVTGSTRAIGIEIARRFAKAGARVFVHGPDRESTLKSAGELANEYTTARISGIVFDVADAKAVENGISSIDIEAGGVDILISNAEIPKSHSCNGPGYRYLQKHYRR